MLAASLEVTPCKLVLSTLIAAGLDLLCLLNDVGSLTSLLFAFLHFSNRIVNYECDSAIHGHAHFIP